MKHYQFEITIQDNETGRVYPKIYASRSQVGPKSYATQCMDSRVKKIQDKALRGNKDITLTTALYPTQ